MWPAYGPGAALPFCALLLLVAALRLTPASAATRTLVAQMALLPSAFALQWVPTPFPFLMALAAVVALPVLVLAWAARRPLAALFHWLAWACAYFSLWGVLGTL